MKKEIFEQIQKEVEKELSASAHDMDHVIRVYNMAIHLAKDEAVDIDVIKAAALLHDIARVKEDNDKTKQIDHALLSAEMCVPILERLNFPKDKIKHVQDCIISHRYRTGNFPKTLEAEILFDADKLDVTGAIGVARSFAIAGEFGQRLCVPLDKSVKQDLINATRESTEKIKDFSKHTPQLEFEIKMRRLGEKLHTKKAKEICKERTKFFEDFLDRLQEESQGLC